MQILLVNPNMTEALTTNMAEIAQAIAGDRARIIPRTAPRGFPYISSRAEAQIAGAIVLEMIADNLDGIDSVIIAAFGDPGLVAARELFDVPVVGMAEASVMTAAMLGEQFGIVTFTPQMTRWYADSVAAAGLWARFTGVRTPEAREFDLSSIAREMRAELVELATAAAREDNADVVILGGAPLAGMASKVARDIPAIVIDPISAATAQAMALASLNVNCRGRVGARAPKTTQGLAASLSAIIARTNDEPV